MKITSLLNDGNYRYICKKVINLLYMDCQIKVLVKGFYELHTTKFKDD